MIPDKSTPIKNEILINIFAKGLLNKDEMRIIFYIIRWSWGFDGVSRRQDWTKELTKRQIANGIEMHESHFNRNINRMIIEKKIIIKDGCYQFNEHYEEWVNLPKSQVLDDNKLTKLVNKTYQNGKVNLPKSQVILTKKVSSTGLKPLQNKPLPDRKETIKETIKETLKEKGDIFLNTWKDFIDMRKEINKKISKVGQSRMLNRLNDLSDDENTQIEILNQSIMNSWTTVWPLKGGINEQFTGTHRPSKEPGEDKYKHLEETY